ncbi:MAG: NADH-quinone oxidoreductase subunit J, partial [Desulfofustis sp.]|nr:NADH-quinone oxidoreductase subunit J [Desulfofustis sp.]
MNPAATVNAAPGLLTADGLLGLIFLVMIALTLTGGFIAATADRLVRALAGVVVCFTGVAGFY